MIGYQPAKVAIVHDNLMAFGGAEVVLESLLELYPQADVYTLTYRPEAFQHSPISQQRIIPSHVNRWPFSRQWYKLFFPLYPAAVEGWDLQAYDLVISSSYNVAHGVLVNPYARHICYMHTPSRWLWSAYHEYTGTPAIFRSQTLRRIMKVAFHHMRLWDWQAAQRPEVLIANSHEVQQRIKKYYHRKSIVVHPPVRVEHYHPAASVRKEEYYVTLGRLVSYKHVDVIIKAFRAMSDKRLVVAGGGPELTNLQRLATGAPNITLMGPVDDEIKTALLQRAKGFIFAPFEDFGITPVEALAAGTPVIAYAKGGALETVVPGKTGVLFTQQSVVSLIDAVKQYEETSFDSETLYQAAEKFSEKHFRRGWEKALMTLGR